MGTRESEPEVPTWVAGLIITAVVLGFGYVVFIGGPLVALAGAVQFALGLFVVYLLYRFVLAVERIAEKL
jgi:hypothetical protein